MGGLGARAVDSSAPERAALCVRIDSGRIQLYVAVECRGGTPSLRLGSARPSRPAPRGTASATRRLGLFAALRHYFLRNRAGRDAFSPRGFAVVRRRGARGHGRHRRAPARAAARRRGGSRQYRELLDRAFPRAEGLPLGTVAVLQQESARSRPCLLREARWQDHRHHALRADPADLRALRRRDCAHDLWALYGVQPGRRARVGAGAPLCRVLVRQRALRQAEPDLGDPEHHRDVSDAARVRVPQAPAEQGENLKAAARSADRCEGRAGQRGILRNVVLDAAQDRARDFLLVGHVVQTPFLVGIADEGRLDQDRGYVGRLQNGKAALLDASLVQEVHPAQFAQHGPAELEAVADLRGEGEVGKSHREIAVLAIEVDPADQVGVVLALGQPLGGGARRAALRQREYRRAAHVRLDEGVGVDRYEQVGFHAPCLVDAHFQGNVIVAVAGEQRAHVGFGIDQGFQLARDRQGDGFLVGPAASPRARVFPAVPGVDDDRDLAADGGHGPVTRGFRRLRLGLLLRSHGFDGFAGGLPGPELGLLLQQGEQRIQGIDRIDIQHQAVPVFADRRERENLRLDFGFQVEHDACDAGLEPPHAQIGDVRVVWRDLAGEFLLHARKIDIFQIEHEPLRVSYGEQAVPERFVRFERYARVVLRRPDANRLQGFDRPFLGGKETGRDQKSESQESRAQPPVCVHDQALRYFAKHRSPAVVWAVTLTSRPAPA